MGGVCSMHARDEKCLINTWSAVPFEDLAVVKLLKKLPEFYESRRFIAVFARGSQRHDSSTVQNKQRRRALGRLCSRWTWLMLKCISRRLDVRVWTELTGLRTLVDTGENIGRALWSAARIVTHWDSHSNGFLSAWCIMPCVRVKIDRRCGVTYRLHLQGSEGNPSIKPVWSIQQAELWPWRRKRCVRVNRRLNFAGLHVIACLKWETFISPANILLRRFNPPAFANICNVLVQALYLKGSK